MLMNGMHSCLHYFIDSFVSVGWGREDDAEV